MFIIRKLNQFAKTTQSQFEDMYGIPENRRLSNLIQPRIFSCSENFVLSGFND